MGMLIDQFCAAVQDWLPESGWSLEDIVIRVFTWTGAAWRIPSERRGEDTTVEDMREALSYLTDEVRMLEDFLVESLIRSLENDLRSLEENVHLNAEKNREQAERWSQLLGDPERLADLSERIRRKHPELAEQEAMDRVRATLEWAVPISERLSTVGFSDPINRGIDVERWRHLTGPILEEENLKRARDEQMRRWGYP